MARIRRQITNKRPDEAELPEKLSEGAALLMKLEASGILQKVGEGLKIRRQGGYCGLDIYVFLLLYFCSGADGSLKRFWEMVRGVKFRVAALAGRRCLPSASAVSRALASVEIPFLREVAFTLLLATSDTYRVLQDPCVQSRDALGNYWHVFDLDPTVTPLRQRALPSHEDLPEARRRVADMGAPGHTGRKRGDRTFRNMVVQHSGSGLWMHTHLSRGNGEGVLDFDLALDAIKAACEKFKLALDRVFVRMDGEFGTVPYIYSCISRSIPFLVRANRAVLYEAPEVLRAMRKGNWRSVPDSLSGPTRSAADLGTLTLEPGARTRRPDGTPYPQVIVRLIASSFPATELSGRGRLLDGYQVELFFTTLPADGWPAEDIVAAYFARGAQENRFAQEDRELGLGHTFSQNLAGQELACLIGLSLWNIRVTEGFLLAPPTIQPPSPSSPQALSSTSATDERTDPLWPRDPVLAKLLKPLDWNPLLENRPAQRFNPKNGTLVCEDERPLHLSSVNEGPRADGKICVVFRRPRGGCEACESRPECFGSSRHLASKNITIPVEPELAQKLKKRIEQLRGSFDSWLKLKPPAYGAGPQQAQEALFLPAMARQLYADLFKGNRFRVEVRKPPPRPPFPRLLARDHADKQRRRCSWTRSVDRYALPEGSEVVIEQIGDPRLLDYLNDTPDPIPRQEAPLT